MLKLVLLLALIYSVVPPVLSQISVQTNRGTIVGYRADYGNDKSKLYYGAADVFLGIPYLQPPVGNLRFAKPQPLTTISQSPFNASKFGDACPQTNYDLRGLNMSENCLFLNIFTPDATSNYKYPVMLYIHGGGFLTGHAADFPVSGIVRNLVSRGVVVVTIQYRLGLLGFFTTRTPDFPANLGLLDQVEAIKWVIQEIPKFGGNPYSITLFGQSAGSASVSAHLFSPVSQNLFQQAIMESGSIMTCFDGATGFKNLSQTRAQNLCNFTETEWNSGNYASLKTCMLNTPYTSFLAEEDGNLYGWNMVQDDYFLPGTPQDLFRNRPNIPVIYGNNKDEWSLADLQLLADGGMSLTNYNSGWYMIIVSGFTFYLPPPRQADVMSILQSVYVDPQPPDSDHVAWLRIINDVLTGASGTGFTGREIDWFLQMNNPNVYTYEFDWPTQVGRPYDLVGWNPVFHCAELYMIFMPDFFWEPVFNNATYLNIGKELQVAELMGQTWTNFAKFGQPTLDNSWVPTTTFTGQEYYRLNVTSAMETGFRRIDRLLWNQAIPALAGVYPPPNPVSHGNDSSSLVKGN